MTLYIEAESNDNFAIFSVATGTFFSLVGKFVLALPSIVISFVYIRFRFGSVTFNLFSIPHFFYEIRHFVVYMVLFLWFEDFMITTTLLKKTVFLSATLSKKNVFFYRFVFDFLSMPFCHFIWKFFYFFVV